MNIVLKRPKQTEVKMDFTIREENVRILESCIGDIEKRFNATVTVEETTYAPSEKHNLRWVQLRGKEGQLMKCAKAYIEALCSPEFRQELKYPPELHEDIQAKKDGLEHKYEYKAVVRFQHKGAIVVSGETEAVLYLVSFLEKEIEEWSFRIQESVIVDTEYPNQHEDQQQRYLEIDTEIQADSGIVYPDIVSHATSRRLAPHTTTSASSMNQRRPQDSGIGETFQHQTRHFEGQRGASSHHLTQSNRTASTASVESGFGSQYHPSTHSAPSGGPHPQRDKTQSPYQWVERNLSREQSLERNEHASEGKQVHISTPPNSVDTKRQRTEVNIKTEILATDCSSSESSFGSSGSMSRRSGSLRNNQSLEFAANAAQRQGYSDQEVEHALQELPPDFKTSDLIRTLRRKRESGPTDVHVNPNGMSSQPFHANVSNVPPRSHSPFPDPGHSSQTQRSDPSVYQSPSASSQPLTHLVKDLSGSLRRDHSFGNTLSQKQSTSKNIDSLRIRQQELLQSLGNQPVGRSPDVRRPPAVGRIEVDSPPPDNPFMTSHEPQYLESSKKAFSNTEAAVGIDHQGKPHQNKLHLRSADREDIMLLNDEQDMECVAALEEAERMDIDTEVQYLRAEFPKGSERPEVMLLTPPRKPDPELVVLDDDDVRTDFKNTRPNEIKLEDRVTTASPKNTKRILAPSFSNFTNNDNLPRIDQVWSESPKIAASLPAVSQNVRTPIPGVGDYFKTMGFADDLDERYATDEPDSISNFSPLQGATEDEIDKHVEKQLQDDFRHGQLQGMTDMEDHEIDNQLQEPLQLSSLNEDYEEPVFEFTSKDTRDSEQVGSEGMDMDQGEPALMQIKQEDNIVQRSLPRLKLHPVPDVQMTGHDKDHLGGEVHDITEIDEHECRMIRDELESSFESDFHDFQIKKEKDVTLGGDNEIRIIKQEKDAEVEKAAPVKEDVQDLIRNFQAEFESQQQDLERKIRERTINETLNMVAEQNEAMQRQINHKQKQLEDEKEKEIVTGQDMEEKLRLEREKMKGELQKELQKEMQEEMRRQIQQQVEQVKQQMEKQKETQAAATAAAAVEKDVIVIKPSQKGTTCPYRPIVIDGSNVAMLHGKRHHTFSCRGIALCVEFLQKMGVEDITVFVPRWRQSQNASRLDRPIRDKEILDSLESKGLLSFTPSRKLRGQYINSYDDRFIVRLAVENGGIIMSNDNFRDLTGESEEWKNVIETRLLMYTFAGDQFMIPDDPYGRNGPTLKQLLLKPKPDVTHRIPNPAQTNPAQPQTNRAPDPTGLSDHQIQELTYSIGVEWERLGTYLRFSHSEIAKIRRDNQHNTDGAIRQMLKTWSGRQRNKSNQYDVLAEALRNSGRADLSRVVLRWKPQNALQQGKGAGGRATQQIQADGPLQHGGQPQFHRGGQAQPQFQQVGQAQPLMQPGLFNQSQAGILGPYPQQAIGGRPQGQHKAPATQSRPPVSDVKKLPQYQQLVDMFADKEAYIVKLLNENPNAEVISLIDKLLS